MGRIGIGELVVIAIIVILLFGATRVADIGKGLGEAVRNLKKGLRDDADPEAAKQLTPGGDQKPKDA
jgi:sec-independent protein translocase protein TatA